MKEKGSIQWFQVYPDLSEKEIYADIRVGIEHIGPRQARKWGYQEMALRLDEQKRVADMQKLFTKEQRPDLYVPLDEIDFQTPQGMEAVEAYYESVLTDCLARYEVAGKEKFESNAERAAEAMRLEFGFKLGNKAVACQSLDAETPLAEGSGAARAKPSAADKPGPTPKRRDRRTARNGNGGSVRTSVGS